MKHKGPLPYAEETSADLNSKAAFVCLITRVPPHGDPRGVVVEGCPACGHSTMFEHAVDLSLDYAEQVQTLGGDAAKNAAGRRGHAYVITVVCRCEEEHPGAPAGQKGCGRYWTVAVEV
jgi:hypothetical protein